jgi:hypothetical protein
MSITNGTNDIYLTTIHLLHTELADDNKVDDQNEDKAAVKNVEFGPKDFELLCMIGKGAYGRVLQVKEKFTGESIRVGNTSNLKYWHPPCIEYCHNCFFIYYAIPMPKLNKRFWRTEYIVCIYTTRR